MIRKKKKRKEKRHTREWIENLEFGSRLSALGSWRSANGFFNLWLLLDANKVDSTSLVAFASEMNYFARFLRFYLTSPKILKFNPNSLEQHRSPRFQTGTVLQPHYLVSVSFPRRLQVTSSLFLSFPCTYLFLRLFLRLFLFPRGGGLFLVLFFLILQKDWRFFIQIDQSTNELASIAANYNCYIK